MIKTIAKLLDKGCYIPYNDYRVINNREGESNQVQKELVEIPLRMITPDPDQPRKVFDKEQLDELARSLEANGLLQPISVREKYEPGTDLPAYIIIAGERRYRAATQLGWDNIDCVVIRQADFRALQLIENINRANLNPVEEARAYRLYLDDGHDVKELAGVIGVRPDIIQWKLGLLEAMEQVQGLVSKGQLQVTVAIEMGKLSPEGQKSVLRALVASHLTSSEAVNLAKRIYAKENALDMFPEVKLSEEETEARRKAKTAIEKACIALEELNRLEDKNPGITGAALATEIEVTTERIDQLTSSLKAFRQSLSHKKVCLVGVG